MLLVTTGWQVFISNSSTQIGMCVRTVSWVCYRSHGDQQNMSNSTSHHHRIYSECFKSIQTCNKLGLVHESIKLTMREFLSHELYIYGYISSWVVTFPLYSLICRTLNTYFGINVHIISLRHQTCIVMYGNVWYSLVQAT